MKNLRKGFSVPFEVADFAGGFYDESSVGLGGDLEARVFGFANAVKNTVSIVGVEGLHAALFFYEKGVNSHGFEAKFLGRGENFFWRLRREILD